jgi:hypothetical protein
MITKSSPYSLAMRMVNEFEKQSYEGNENRPQSSVRRRDERGILLDLQRNAGNQAVQSLFRSGLVQAKLTIGRIDDPAEREAHAVANGILGAPAGRKMRERPNQEGSSVQRHPFRHDASASVPGIVEQVLHSAGRPLDPASRAFFESRFGHDFSHVRIHADSEAAASARSINAEAYTFGSDVVFADGRFAPATQEGMHLISHELTHVIQQTRSPATPSTDHPIGPVPIKQASASTIARSPRDSSGGDTAESDIVALYPFMKGTTNELERSIESESRTVGDVYHPPEYHDTGVWHVDASGLRQQLSILEGRRPLTSFEESLVSTWNDRDDSPILLPYIQIGFSGVLAYSLIFGSSGKRLTRIYDKYGTLLHETSDEVPLVNMGLGPIDYVLLAAGLAQLARMAVGKWLAKRAAMAEIGDVAAGGMAPRFSYATNESWTYAGREVRIIRTPTRTRALYKRTGMGREGPLGPQRGDWAPFRGFGPGGNYVKAAEIHGEVEFAPWRPLTEYGFEDEEGTLINSWLKTEAPPLSPVEVGDAWAVIQEALRRHGVELAFPGI